ncbi:hypothetical protein SGPA1_31000 [Streptomyces misionensis JCM 4497]
MRGGARRARGAARCHPGRGDEGGGRLHRRLQQGRQGVRPLPRRALRHRPARRHRRCPAQGGAHQQPVGQRESRPAEADGREDHHPQEGRLAPLVRGGRARQQGGRLPLAAGVHPGGPGRALAGGVPDARRAARRTGVQEGRGRLGGGGPGGIGRTGRRTGRVEPRLRLLPEEGRRRLRRRAEHEHAARLPHEHGAQAWPGPPVHRPAPDPRRLRPPRPAHGRRRRAGLLHHPPLREADGRRGHLGPRSEQGGPGPDHRRHPPVPDPGVDSQRGGPRPGGQGEDLDAGTGAGAHRRQGGVGHRLPWRGWIRRAVRDGSRGIQGTAGLIPRDRRSVTWGDADVPTRSQRGAA